jgi:L-lactate dehydrogenase
MNAGGIMKIGVIGCGHVGSAGAYACLMRGIGTQIVMIDKNAALAEAQAEDILHATPFSKSMAVQAGSYDDLAGCGVVVVTAGVNQKPGETRLDLLKRNAAVFEEILPPAMRSAPKAIFIVATNPVDIMTAIAIRIAKEHKIHAARIIGSGTILDTARFRSLLAGHLHVSSHSVHAHVIGEHGDSEVLHWSGASVSNMSLQDFSAQMGHPVTEETKAQIDEAVRKAAYKIIAGKGATWYGIGAGIARIAYAIENDEHCVLTCSTLLERVEGVTNVCLSLPHIISAEGIERTLYPELESHEANKLHESACILKQFMERI